uniref:Cullin domain-containing protein n=1 Tax=Heterorhabditis bacteriophora TaxID=37862 RepID=A0A1I7X6Y8_HETBA
MFYSQTAHFGCPSTDIVRLLNACLSGKDRRNHWKSLLETYYGYLKEEIGEGTMPFSFEQVTLGLFMLMDECYNQYHTTSKLFLFSGAGISNGENGIYA